MLVHKALGSHELPLGREHSSTSANGTTGKFKNQFLALKEADSCCVRLCLPSTARTLELLTLDLCLYVIFSDHRMRARPLVFLHFKNHG